MENNKEVISDLKGLVNILNDGKEGYQSAADATDNIELKAIFLKYVAERTMYQEELKAHLLKHGDSSDNDEGGVLGMIHRTWIDIKEAITGKSEAALLGAITTGETAALEKFDSVLEDVSLHQDHLNLLQSQRNGISEALNSIKALQQKYENS